MIDGIKRRQSRCKNSSGEDNDCYKVDWWKLSLNEHSNNEKKKEKENK